MTKSDDAGTWLNASSRNLPEKLKKKRKKKDAIEIFINCRDECNCHRKHVQP